MNLILQAAYVIENWGIIIIYSYIFFIPLINRRYIAQSLLEERKEETKLKNIYICKKYIIL